MNNFFEKSEVKDALMKLSIIVVVRMYISSILTVGWIIFVPYLQVFKLMIMFGFLRILIWLWKINLLQCLKLPMKDLNPSDFVGFYALLVVIFLLNLSLQVDELHTLVDFLLACVISVVSLYIHWIIRLFIIMLIYRNDTNKFRLFQYDFKYMVYIGLLRLIVALVFYLFFLSGAAWALPGDDPHSNLASLRIRIAWDKIEKFNTLHSFVSNVTDTVGIVNEKTSDWQPNSPVVTPNGHWMNPRGASYPRSLDMKNRDAYQQYMGKLMSEYFMKLFKKS